MELLVNDLSIHGQFSTLADFKKAIKRVLEIRRMAMRFGRQLHCHRKVAHTQVMAGVYMQQAVNSLSKDESRAVMRWLTHQGPFWEDNRLHSPNEYFEWMDQFLEGLKNTKPAKGHERVLYPGLSEWEETEERSKNGIPYHREVVEWFESYAAETGIDIDLR